MKIFKTYVFRNLLTKELEAANELIKLSSIFSIEELQALRTLAESSIVRYRLIEQLKYKFYYVADHFLSSVDSESDMHGSYACIISQIQQKAGAIATGYCIDMIYCTVENGIFVEVNDSDPRLTESVKMNAEFLPTGEARRILEDKITTNKLVFDVSFFVQKTSVYA